MVLEFGEMQSKYDSPNIHYCQPGFMPSIVSGGYKKGKLVHLNFKLLALPKYLKHHPHIHS